MKKLLLYLLLTLLLTTGCSFFNSTKGPVETVTKTIELQEDTTLGEIELSFGVGKLQFIGSSTHLMDGTFTSNIDSLMPKFDHRERSQKELLSIKPRSTGLNISGNIANDWKLAFSNEIPLSFLLKLGVGENNLSFAGLIIEDLNVNAGVGDTVIDLSEVKNNDFNVDVSSGVGRTKLIFSEEHAVHIKISKGLGSVSARGFISNGDIYETDVESEEVVNVTIKQGIGEIVLETK